MHGACHSPKATEPSTYQHVTNIKIQEAYRLGRIFSRRTKSILYREQAARRLTLPAFPGRGVVRFTDEGEGVFLRCRLYSRVIIARKRFLPSHVHGVESYDYFPPDISHFRTCRNPVSRRPRDESRAGGAQGGNPCRSRGGDEIPARADGQLQGGGRHALRRHHPQCSETGAGRGGETRSVAGRSRGGRPAQEPFPRKGISPVICRTGKRDRETEGGHPGGRPPRRGG